MNYEKLHTLINQGRLGEARAYINEILHINTNNAIVWKAKSFIEFKNDDFDGALNSINRAIEINRNDSEAQKNKGLILIKSGSKQSAYRCFEKLVKLIPNDVDIHTKLAALSYDLGRKYEAIEHYKKSLNIDNNLYEIHRSIGRIYYELANYNEAIVYYKNTLKNNPEDFVALADIGACYLKMKSYKKAEESLANSLLINPRSSFATNSLGIVNVNLGRLTTAVSMFRDAISLDSTNADAYENLISVLIEAKERNEALKLCDIAVNKFSNTIIFRVLKGICLAKTNDTSAAIGYLEDNIKFDNENKIIHTALAEMKFENCQFYEASLIFEELSKLKNRYDAYYKLARLRLYEGKDDIASIILKKISSSNNNEYRIKSNIDLGVLNYLNGNLAECKFNLESSKNIQGERSPWARNFYAYWIYLNELLKVNSSKHDYSSRKYNAIIIGDSHSIGMNGLLVGSSANPKKLQTKWIPGLKLWHLAESKMNIYKIRLNSILSNAVNETVYFSVGEIDSRHNEGVFYYAKMNKLECNQIAAETIEKALIYLKEIGQNLGLNISLIGIPPPSTGSLQSIFSIEEREIYVGYVKNFNHLYKDISHQMGCEYIDVFSEMTTKYVPEASITHLDDFHLHPKIYKDILLRN